MHFKKVIHPQPVYNAYTFSIKHISFMWLRGLCFLIAVRFACCLSIQVNYSQNPASERVQNDEFCLSLNLLGLNVYINKHLKLSPPQPTAIAKQSS